MRLYLVSWYSPNFPPADMEKWFESKQKALSFVRDAVEMNDKMFKLLAHPESMRVELVNVKDPRSRVIVCSYLNRSIFEVGDREQIWPEEDRS